MRDVFGVRADAAQDAEHGLHEERRLHQAAVEEVLQIVKVPDVVAFELEASPVFAQRGENELDILEGIAEHEIARVFEMLALPFELKLVVAAQEVKETEIDRSHVERGDLGLEH